ncbi:DEAD/DEAH box helicase [Pseudomonas aeruginosa]|uniref:DEAD/DEAH box helicase n=1 Tax=Pseudomonas aeruginosa TaxID=287 RepID=UPI000B0903F2|nr:DEAD/DEAH box helicase [Pseudomonas aeruginosa]MCT5519319.1 DEAD/DEAH box helicase [Pseudomonas aeruginosa]MEE2515674.1 DEAD/DEAH box helicase [Pseudomonas aeruginosa]HEJ1327454.1 DEAD/DEAH box helicase [Pseudomonas aeruginosa]
MKLEFTSKNLLGMARSRAKLQEFSIPSEYHMPLAGDPRRLLVATIGILGELSAIEARADDSRESDRAQLKEQLILVGQYFDALTESKLAEDLSTYLSVLGAAAYYLADMPGSSGVIIKALPDNFSSITDSYLEAVLVWVLKSDLDREWYYYKESLFLDETRDLVDEYYRFWKFIAGKERVLDAGNALRRKVYLHGSDRELLLVDTLMAVISRKISYSSIECLPRYSGLDLEQWRAAILKPSFINELWPAQRLLGEQGVLRGVSAVVQMPTSAGKTKSAELVIRSAFISGRAKLAVVVAPFRALCREISQTFKRAFEGDAVNVNELRDITNIDDGEKEFLKFLLGDAYRGNYEHTILVSTPEKLVYLLRHEPSLTEKVGLLIFDEGHQFDSGRRGVTYELLVSALRETVKPDAQKLLISAVMANAENIGDWLNGEMGVSLQGSKLLPTLKSVAYLSWVTEMGQLFYLNQSNDNVGEMYVPKVVQQVNLGRKRSEKKDRIFPDSKDPKTIPAYLGLRLCSQGPVAVFCGSKKSVGAISKLIVDYYERGLELEKPRYSSDSVELDKISYLSELHYGKGNYFARAISLGALPHSANIPSGIRVAVEWAMEHNKAKLVICTSTLAQGVNLPIKYLVVSSTMQGGQKISIRDFQNLIGRAGRSGYHTEGSVIFADPKLYDDRFTRYGAKRWGESVELLDFSKAEACLSSLKELIEPFHYPGTEAYLMPFLENPYEERDKAAKWAKESNQDISLVLAAMDKKIQIIESIESYFLASLKDSPSNLGYDQASNVAKQTLAYHLSTESEREILISAFERLSARILSVSPDKFSYYGKTLLGLERVKYIDSWVSEHGFDIELSDGWEDILELCWGLIELYCQRGVLANIASSSMAKELCQMWVSGKSYHELLSHASSQKTMVRAGTQRRKISLDHVIDLTAIFSYEAMLIIGAVADVMEGQGFDEAYTSYARYLQDCLKMGLSEPFEMWLYGKGYADREVCKFIASQVDRKHVPDYMLLDFLSSDAAKESIVAAVADLPSVFSDVALS